MDSGICVQRRDTLICRLASVIREMLGNRVSTSVDYPNLYRHRHGQGTTYRLAGAKRIPAFKVGGTWRFSRADIDEWISIIDAETSHLEHRDDSLDAIVSFY